MRAAPQTTSPPAVSPAGLGSDFTWTFAGNAVYAASQWAILSLIAKLGGGEMLGKYALAMAVTTPAVMLTHLNLRAVLATDIERRHVLGDYLAVRLQTSAAGMAVIALLAFIANHSLALAATIVLMGLSQSAETVSDTYYGALQRRELMKPIGLSMMARAVISVAALGAVLWLTRDLLWAVLALALARLAVLLAYDRSKGSENECLSRPAGWRPAWIILRTALPLGVVLMLVALNTNLPRYVIQHYLGIAELGAFAAVASFVSIGSTVVNALGQVATPRLARYFSEGDLARFRQTVVGLVAWVLALGAGGVLCAAVLGRIILRVVYRPEFESYSGLLVAVMGAAMVGYLAISLGYVITSTRAFNAQMPLFCCVAASCGILSLVSIPRLGLPGAVLALAAAACLQICGELLILAWRFRRQAASRRP